MFLFKKVKDLQQHLETVRNNGGIIGFVPTMGALHEGHLSLIQQANDHTDCAVASIFVNPTQFNDVSDLDKYPRTTSADIEMLSSADNNILFLPPVNEVYPKGLETKLSLDFGNLATVMEGEFRPGHFDGMAQVVNRLLDIVQPHQLFMGQKDFQQLTIVRSMLRQLNSSIELKMCPIIREEDGLAMSSRNRRLPEDHRKKAILLSQTLQMARQMMDSRSPDEVTKFAMEKLDAPDFKPEYFSIVDGITLQPVKRFEDSEFIVACTAVWLGEVRLIDNLVFKEKL